MCRKQLSQISRYSSFFIERFKLILLSHGKLSCVWIVFYGSRAREELQNSADLDRSANRRTCWGVPTALLQLLEAPSLIFPKSDLDKAKGFFLGVSTEALARSCELARTTQLL